MKAKPRQMVGIKRREFGLMFKPGLEAVSLIGQEVTPKIEKLWSN
jgi:hypothetical protein